MSKAITLVLLGLTAAAALAATPFQAAFDTVYRCYVAKDLDQAQALLSRLEAEAKSAQDRFAVKLELGDFLLDKKADYAGAEGVYSGLAADFPKHKLVPDVLYRLALAQELQEKYLEAAKNYEKVATRYSKSRFGTDALDAIERCFRKNYQDRVAYVDGYPLTRIELDDRISRNPAAYEKYEKKQELLDTMIDNRLLYSAALAADITKDTMFVFNLSEQRNRAVFQEWYEQTVNSKTGPSEKTLKAAYKKDLAAKYTTPEKVRAYQIQVSTKAEADSVRAALLADTTLVWDSVAKQVSKAPDKDKGGDLGLFARGSQPKPIEQAAFKLKPGTISQPIQVKDGWVILKVTEKKPKTVRTFADVRNQLSSDLKQQNSSKLYEQVIADLKAKAVIVTDTTAIEQGKETLATVNGFVISKAALETRLNAVPAFFRAQFETPEGKRRLLDNLILEKLLLQEGEAQKLWLVNKVVDQVLTRRANFLIDTYRQTMTTKMVTLDSARLMAEYNATIAEFKEPTKVHAREIAATTQSRAGQLRRWVEKGRLSVLIQGRGLLVSESDASLLEAFIAEGANTDSILGACALGGTPAQLQGMPFVAVGGKNLPDLSQKSKLTGPYAGATAFGLAFNDLSKEDKLYQPDFTTVTSQEQLDALLGKAPPPETAAARPTDSTKLGTYVTLSEALPADFVSGLFKLAEKGVSKPFKTPAGTLVVKVTKKDTAQKASFQDIAKRFSKAPSRWSGGDLYTFAKDDKSHDAKLVKAAFSLSKGGISPVIKLNDSTYTFVLMEEKKDAYTRPFSEVKAKIENKLRRQQEKELYDQLLKDLRAKAKVEIVMKESDFIIEPEPEEPPTLEPPKQK